jgi:predicted transcriptional regulator
MSAAKVIRVGIMPMDAIRDYTLAIARGQHKPRADEPKVWFTSMKSFASVLSDENRDLLRVIFDRKPESISELERLTGRKANNLSRTLHTMERYGLVRLEEGAKGRGRQAVRPVAAARVVRLEVDIAGGMPSRGRSGNDHDQRAVA